MKGKNKLYNIFDTVILRTPLFPYTAYLDNSQNNSTLFKEAVYLASPDFYDQMNNASDLKVKKTLYKYYSRSCMRCTPFGLFAFSTIVNFHKSTNIQLKPHEQFIKNVRLDTRCVYEIVKYLESIKSIKQKLVYYPNEFLYQSGDSLRYLEFVKANNIFNCNIVSVEETEYLNQILDFSKYGKTIEEIAAMLVSDDITNSEALEYIDSLIECHILLSNISKPENDCNWFSKIINYISEINETNIELKKVYDLLSEINLNGENQREDDIERYNAIYNELISLGLTIEKNQVFHVDTLRASISASLSDELKKQILAGVHFICYTSEKRINFLLDRFKIRFRDRYENQEVALLNVMDTETGIDYLNGDNKIMRSDFLNGLNFPEVEDDSIIKISSIEKLLMRKYTDCIKKNSTEIIFDTHDITYLSALNIKSYPNTFSALCSVFINKDLKYDIHFKSIGSSSASCVLARFSHLDCKISEFIDTIHCREKDYYNDLQETITAEIMYMPDEKAGNLMVKSNFREYEIALGAYSNTSKSHRIPLSDLRIQLVEDEIILKSQTLNKRIIPYLSSAYNLQNNQLPILRFLCDLQFQNEYNLNLIDWNLLYGELDYFPRIRYENCIFSRQKWAIIRDEVENIDILDERSFLKQVKAWINKRNIPSKILYVEYDNELLIDIENITSFKLLLQILKTKRNIIVEEFLYSDETSIVTDGERGFTNEFVFSFYKI